MALGVEKAKGVASLEDIHSSVPIPRSTWRRFLAFSGPAFLISVGYMDPGNWGSDLKAGSVFGYRLLWVLLLSNLMALLLQSLATRLGVVSGRDLAQACRESYPRTTAFALWILSEIAIAATDLAEVIGAVIALKLLFGLPYLWGLIIAACDTFLLLALQRRGVRLLEVATLALIGVIAVSFVIEISLADTEWGAVARGFLPTFDTSSSSRLTSCVYIAISMLGATVMPHNLYLHSALVQSRAYSLTEEGKRLACKYNFFDSFLALNGAFFVNAAILVLAASTFLSPDRPEGVERLQDAYQFLGKNVWGGALASGLFAVALLASGQSSTLTGTLAGQVVMEGFVNLRVRPWLRRLVTRTVAIVPALVVIGWAGNETVAGGVDEADASLMSLLVLSQVVLSFQLPFAIVPLIQFTSDRRRMGAFVSRRWLNVLGWSSAVVVVGLNAFLIYQTMNEWADGAGKRGWNPLWVYAPSTLVSLGMLGFLAWVTVYPHLVRREPTGQAPSAPQLAESVRYQNIGVAVEFAPADGLVLTQAAALARTHGAELVLVHVVEGLAAAYLGSDADDQESRADRARMAALVDHLRTDGLTAEGLLGYGSPPEELVRIARDRQFDLLVLGTHGHRFFADLALGQTVAPVLHRLTIPVLVVPTRSAPAINLPPSRSGGTDHDRPFARPER
jgi:manganese transport protein